MSHLDWDRGEMPGEKRERALPTDEGYWMMTLTLGDTDIKWYSGEYDLYTFELRMGNGWQILMAGSREIVESHARTIRRGNNPGTFRIARYWLGGVQESWTCGTPIE